MTPFVLLHAFPFDAEMFECQNDPFAEITHIIEPDLPGFGHADVEPGITIEGMSDYVIAILDRCGIRKAVIGGVSMGGYVAMAIARRHPDRVSGLVLADTRAEPDDEAAKASRAKAIETVRTQGVAALVDAQIPKMLSATTQREKPELVEWIRKIGYRQNPEGVIAGIQMLRDRPDARLGLQDVKCPTLIVVGEEDTITPPSAAMAMKALIPQATLVTIPNAGHLANCERPEAFNVAVRKYLSTIA